MKMSEIKLGDKVRDIHTGFVGTAMARTEFINGCVQYNVIPKADKINKMPEEMSIDESCLEIIKPLRKEIKKGNNGGPMRKAFRQRGY